MEEVATGITWANGAAGGTPLTADNLNRMNKSTTDTFNSVIGAVNTLDGEISEIDDKIGDINDLLIRINSGAGV